MPISHFFKARLPARWACIHSLHVAKHYPTTTAEWDVLPARQNRVTDSLLAPGSTIRIVVNSIKIDCYLFTAFGLENIDVFVDDAGETDFQSFQFETIWEDDTLNPLLMMITEDEMRAFVIGPAHLISVQAPVQGLVIEARGRPVTHDSERERCA